MVQIFNVVRKQQNETHVKLAEAGPSVRKRDKVMGSLSKKRFLDLLDSSSSAKGDSRDTAEKVGSRGNTAFSMCL